MKQMRWLMMVVGLGACSVSTQLGVHGFSTSGGGGGGGETSDSGPRTFVVPNVFGMARADAIAALERAGYEGTADDDTHSTCGSVVDGKIIELGQVCYQSPGAGQKTGTRLPMTLRVQTEDPRHGRLGDEVLEWHLMPNVVGMPIDRALAVLKKTGFTAEEHNKVYEREKPGCAAGIVCEQYPEANQRSGRTSDRALTVGAKPASAAQPPQPPQPPQQPPPAKDPKDPGALF